MRQLRFSLLVLILTSVFHSAAFAQSAPAADAPPVADPAMLPEPADPSREAARPARRAPDRTQAEQVVSGSSDKGTVDLTGTASGFTASGVLLKSEDAAPSISAKLGAPTTSYAATDLRFSVFDSANVNLFTVRGDRRVGIGTASPGSRLSIFNTESALVGVTAWTETAFTTGTSQADTALWSVGRVSVGTGVSNGGSVVATRTAAHLNGAGTLSATYGNYIESGVRNNGVVTSAYGSAVFVTSGTGTITNGYGVYIADVAADTDFAVYANGASDTSYFAGNIGIGTTTPTTKLDVVGSVKVTGDISVNSITSTTGIKAVYQDLAEWVPSTIDVPAGTVVVLDRAQTNQVMPSSVAYDTTVAGVVSENPGVLLGVGAANKEMVATTGRVKVRVDARRASIAVGDLLVTSDIPGMAMKSEPMDVSGRKFHQPGTIIGKALEPLEGGLGEILVLLSMQ